MSGDAPSVRKIINMVGFNPRPKCNILYECNTAQPEPSTRWRRRTDVGIVAPVSGSGQAYTELETRTTRCGPLSHKSMVASPRQSSKMMRSPPISMASSVGLNARRSCTLSVVVTLLTQQ